MSASLQLAAAAIANARGNRRGVPSIVNILDLLPEKLRVEVIEDAKAALEAVGFSELCEALEALTIHPRIRTLEDRRRFERARAALAKARGLA